MILADADVGNLMRRALEERIAAFLAVHPEQKVAHRELAERYDNLATALRARKLGVGAVANERFNINDFLPSVRVH